MIRHFLGLCEDNHTHFDLIDCIVIAATLALGYKLAKSIKWNTQIQKLIK